MAVNLLAQEETRLFDPALVLGFFAIMVVCYLIWWAITRR